MRLEKKRDSTYCFRTKLPSTETQPIFQLLVDELETEFLGLFAPLCRPFTRRATERREVVQVKADLARRGFDPTDALVSLAGKEVLVCVSEVVKHH